MTEIDYNKNLELHLAEFYDSGSLANIFIDEHLCGEMGVNYALEHEICVDDIKERTNIYEIISCKFLEELLGATTEHYVQNVKGGYAANFMEYYQTSTKKMQEIITDVLGVYE